MGKLEKHKKMIIVFGICALILALASSFVGVWVIVDGIKGISTVGANVSNVFGLVAGFILCISAFTLFWVGLYFSWVGANLLVEDINVKKEMVKKPTPEAKKEEAKAPAKKAPAKKAEEKKVEVKKETAKPAAKKPAAKKPAAKKAEAKPAAKKAPAKAPAKKPAATKKAPAKKASK